jgi:two-component system nitrogen regulation response regulator GlnG
VRGESGILDNLTAEFERTLIRVALAHTGGRKIEAATLLGWGRNTLTRKIQELGMEAGDD